MGEQMQQMREEICFWVAPGKLVGVLAEQGGETTTGKRRGKWLFFIFDFAGSSEQESLLLVCLGKLQLNYKQREGDGGGGMEVGNMEFSGNEMGFNRQANSAVSLPHSENVSLKDPGT